MNISSIVAVVVTVAATVIVLAFILGWIGALVALPVAYLIFRKRRARLLRTIAFAIGVIMVIIGVGGLWLIIGDDIVRFFRQ